ncbi:MAG: UDP-N-acetylmuramoyl-L-alanyl-D-glutamate--2,6-diaminopimelate ligase [Deltaproteobacteria bacterium CG2_30_66_27]|nr:MAG: UDP-N-acetylmuramoyl-L-alanyl-D-glutamate--2,6-diaminopimelate ligase [Deltaproteobacteria bacterium CG2_30_66_27]
MRLAELLAGIVPGPVGPPGEIEIEGISVDSRSVRPGDLFVAVSGGSADGHAYLADAARAGAVAALVERELPSPSLPVVRVPSTAAALPGVAVAFHGDPSAKLRVTGVTGTNGKTTVTYLIEGILAAAGRVPAVIGTINYRVAGAVLRKGLTTPFPHDLQAVTAEAVALGATDLLMEVSSHSAAQGRIEGVRFDVGIFTNLTRDHLDFHGDMESYFFAKARFFREYLPAGGKRIGIALNGDDPYGERLAGEFPSAATFGFSRSWDVHPEQMAMTWEGTRMVLATPAGPLALRSPLIGAHNVSNIMAAVAGGLLLSVDPAAVAAGVAAAGTIPGRLEPIPNARGLHLFVDYAHTPDGMDRVLSTLRGLTEGRLVTVFGCGGNRDRGKRPAMGGVAALRSDVVVLTSDNPRDEDPVAILAEIVPGLTSEGLVEAHGPSSWREGFFRVEADRKAAIALALSLAEPGDTVAIVGKGHEDVQIIGNRRLPFDDRQAVRDVLAAGG